MADNDTGGNAVDSPTTDDSGQVTSTTDQGTTAGDSGTTDQGQTADSQPATTGDDKGTKSDTKSDLPDKDTLPFDQHPKWISARNAEKRLNELIDEQGYDSIDDLISAAREHKSLKELIGDRDPEQVVGDYEEFQNVKRYWADQEAAKREANEEPHETIDRLKREKQDLIDNRKREEDERKAGEEDHRMLINFDNSLRTKVGALTDRSDAEKSLLLEFFGVDNEMASVDVKNPAAINKAWDNCLKRFDQLKGDIEQAAIDKYAAGKSDITPVTGSEGTGSQAADSTVTDEEGDHLKPGTTPEQFDRDARATLLRRLEQAKAAP